VADIKRPTFPLTGGCPCGAIRYEIATMPISVYACHCTDCQRRSGSAFALNLPVRSATLRIVQGSPKGWHTTSQRGVAATAWFCGDCGCRIYGERQDGAGVSFVRAGTLDDTSWLRPAAHYFMRSAQSWETVSGEAKCFDTMPADAAELGEVIAAWRTMMGESPDY
jgi:hypothetical protein